MMVVGGRPHTSSCLSATTATDSRAPREHEDSEPLKILTHTSIPQTSDRYLYIKR